MARPLDIRGSRPKTVEPLSIGGDIETDDIVRNLLIVARNKHNNPDSIEYALAALQQHRGVEEVAQFFEDKARRDKIMRAAQGLKSKPVK